MSQTTASVYPADRLAECLGGLRDAVVASSEESRLLADLLIKIAAVLTNLIALLTTLLERAAEAGRPAAKPQRCHDDESAAHPSKPSIRPNVARPARRSLPQALAQRPCAPLARRPRTDQRPPISRTPIPHPPAIERRPPADPPTSRTIYCSGTITFSRLNRFDFKTK